MYNNMQKSRRLEFRIELMPPTDPDNIPQYFEKFKCVLKYTKRFSIVSHSVADSITGFDRGFNLAKYLLSRDENVNILFHLTCKDLNRVNIESRLTLLKNLGIRRLLLITGEQYSKPDKFHRLYFANSTELVQHISGNFGSWFESLAVAGYPEPESQADLLGDELVENPKHASHEEQPKGSASSGGNNSCTNDSFHSLSGKLHLLKVDSIYTQCVWNANMFERFINRIDKSQFANQLNEIVPSVAVFQDQATLDRVAKLTRVKSPTVTGRATVNQITPTATCGQPLMTEQHYDNENHCKQFIVKLCLDLKTKFLPSYNSSINICAFNLFDLTSDIMEQLQNEL